MEPSESRLVTLPRYPNFAYVQMLFYYMASNFAFYHFIFRRTGDRRQFAAFMLVNLFTSHELGEATNPSALKHYAGYINNIVEREHRR